jgi:hypothetical protein
MIEVSAFALLAMSALPIAVDEQAASAPKSSAADSSRAHPGGAQGRGDAPLHSTVKGSATSHGKAGQASSQAGGGVNDARGNEERTNSQAATSGAVDGRNALAPNGTAMGPDGAPPVGVAH